LGISKGPQFVPVDVRPMPRNRPLPRYPRGLAQRGIGGTVTMWVLVTASGAVADVRVLRSSGNEHLDGAAVEAVRRVRYTPAQRRGSPVPAWTQHQVVFK
jgi:TonB family protein